MESIFTQRAVAVLKEYCNREYDGSVNAMVEGLGIEVGNGVVHKWFRGNGNPQLKILGMFMDKIGAEVVCPGLKISSNTLTPSDNPVQNSITALKLENDNIRKERDSALKELEAVRLERDMARGEIQALERMLSRFMPQQSEKEAVPSSDCTTSGSSKAV